MLKIGQRAKIDIKLVKKCNKGETREHKVGRIFSLTDKLITIQYTKYGKPTYKNSFNVADVIERKAVINVWINGAWQEVTKNDFKI